MKNEAYAHFYCSRDVSLTRDENEVVTCNTNVIWITIITIITIVTLYDRHHYTTISTTANASATITRSHHTTIIYLHHYVSLEAQLQG